MIDRLKKLREILKEQSLDSCLISSVPNIFYLTGVSNFFTEGRDGYLLITPKNQYLLTSHLYIEGVRKNVTHFECVEIRSDYSYKQAITDLVKMHRLTKVGIEEDDLRVSEYKKFKNIVKSTVDTDLSKLRIKKEKDEIEKISAACKLADQGCEYVVKSLKVGVTEKQVASQFELFVIQNGGKLSFETIIAFGENSAIPHHHPTDKKLKVNDFVLIDCGAKIEGYCSDMTRTFVFGKSNEKQKFILQTVIDSQQAAINYISKQLGNKKISTGFEVDKVAREHIKDHGFDPYLHGLGHGTGIQIHEPPRLSPKSKDDLEEGMLFSIEPGIYVPGVGGVRIEDLFTIKDRKLIQLTNAPKI